MPAIAVAAARGVAFEPDALESVEVLDIAQPSALADWLTRDPANQLVIYSDGVPDERREALGRAVAPNRERVLEVRGDRWDGFAHSPLSGSVRGVIGGFGEHGLRAALEYLRSP